MDERTPNPQTYATLLASIKQRIQTAQVRASLAVNRELVLLYWSIGKEILARQQEEGWGAKVIETLGRDLKRSFPEMRGLSMRNLKYMKAFADAWPDESIVQQLVAQLPWGHNVRLLDKLSLVEERLWYVREEADRIDWNGTRLLCIAADFTRYDEHAVQQINRNIELIRYRKFGHELLLLELVNVVSVKASETKPPKVGERRSGDKTVTESVASLQGPLLGSFRGAPSLPGCPWRRRSGEATSVSTSRSSG
ncbi:MAG: hypothetical protein H7Y20_07815 [Bryobacteraceae bacterium]|nr:hypothetical protein [Bryobacteraceae bacterium]